MSSQERKTVMEQKIFDQGLSVEAVSAYLLGCALVDEERPLTLKNLRAVWNGSEAELHRALENLEDRGILRKIIASSGNQVFQLQALDRWRTP